MPLDRTLLPCSLHPLHTCSVLFSPSPHIKAPSGRRQGWAVHGAGVGWEELCSTRVPCPCSPCPQCSCCASLQLPVLFAAGVSCVSLRALCSRWGPGKRGKGRDPSSVPAVALGCAGLKVPLCFREWGVCAGGAQGLGSVRRRWHRFPWSSVGAWG